MSKFGPTPATGAHARGNPLLPKRDLSVEAGHRPMPPVPRTRRAPERKNSAGAFARAAYERPDSHGSVGSTRSSEQRRPSGESPFARVSHLSRERESSENQRFEMGPGPRAKPVGEQDHSRGHILGRETEHQEGGMPWQRGHDEESEDRSKGPAARRSVLRAEQQAADQGLEWVPSACRKPPRRPDGVADEQERTHGRRNELARERVAADEAASAFPSLAAGAGLGPQSHGRRQVLQREEQKVGHAPALPSCLPGEHGTVPAEAVPSYGRRNLLEREGNQQAQQVAAH